MQSSYAQETIEIAILGGGMSGLTAAYTLKKNMNIDATLYEGRDRLGGRINTHYFDDGSFYEEGGTFIDSDHTEAINLAKELGVPLVKRGYGTRRITVIHDGESQDTSTLCTELSKIKKELDKQLDEINKNNNWVNYNTNTDQYHYNPLTPHLVNLSPLGKSFIQTYYEDETGLGIGQAPSSTLSWLIEETDNYTKLLTAKKSIFVPSFLINQLAYNYTAQGGMSTFVNTLRDNLISKNINLGHKLTHIGKEDERYLLTFQTNEGKKYVKANKLLITLPFSTLKDVSIDNTVGLSDFQKKAIQTLPYGTNSKIGISVKSSKNIYDDMLYYLNLDDYLIGWPGKNALTLMVNAETGENLDDKTSIDIVKQQKKFVTTQYSEIENFGTMAYKNWTQDEFSRGSYSTFTTNVAYDLCSPHDNQSLFPGMRQFADPVNNSLFIAGEHTRSDGTSGHIEGAIRSGIQAAQLLEKAFNN